MPREWIFENGVKGYNIKRDSRLREDTNIYHLLPWRFALSIFKESRLRLSPVKTWKDRDPYELWWYSIIEKSVLQPAYGLCWTTSSYDEPVWRMAAFGREPCMLPIVRIRSTVALLLWAAKQLSEGTDGSMYIGKVDYKKKNELTKLGRSDLFSDKMFVKRNNFRIEKEIRLLILQKKNYASEFHLNIEPKKVINQIMISPHATEHQRKQLKSEFNKYGITTRHSLILSPPRSY